MSTSNGTSRKRDRDDRFDFEYTGREAVPFDVTHVRLHSSVTEVYTDAFRYCERLTEVVFNEGISKIGKRAFMKCTALQSIKLPSTLTEIGNSAFWKCSSLRDIVFNEGLTKIGISAFEQCESLLSVKLPSSLIVLDKSAFHGCSSLNEVLLHEGLKNIGNRAFQECKLLQSITIPSSVAEIGPTSFANCFNLKQIELNRGLKKIGDFLLYGCNSLERISLPSTLTDICRYSFKCCNNLRVVELHGIVQKIGDEAFANCQSLERFVFPNISTRLENIIQTGHWSEVEGKIDEIRGLVQRRGSQIFISAAVMNSPRVAGSGSNWNIIKAYVDRINELITYYEKKESTSLFELALWKAKIDQTEANDINRDACRIEVPGPVKEAILQYLG